MLNLAPVHVHIVHARDIFCTPSTPSCHRCLVEGDLELTSNRRGPRLSPSSPLVVAVVALMSVLGRITDADSPFARTLVSRGLGLIVVGAGIAVVGAAMNRRSRSKPREDDQASATGRDRTSSPAGGGRPPAPP